MKKDQTNIALPNVAIVTSRFPHPLDKGDKLRIFHHIKQASKFFRITLICLHEVPLSEKSMTVVASYCEEIHSFQLPKWKRIISAVRFLLLGRPMQVGYFYNQEIKERITWILTELNPIHVHCHMLRMVPYIALNTRSTYSLDYMDSMILNDMAGQHLKGLALGFIRNMERRRVAAYELESHGKFGSHFIISERDKKHLDTSIRSDVKLLSNGVALEKTGEYENTQKIYDLCFCGNLGYVPNKKAIAYILDKILPAIGKVSSVIAGAEASPELFHRTEDGLTILSPVDDMSVIYKQSRILIAPIYSGSGQQNKILEAMALGVPCITTSFVNESIGANNGEEIILADDANSFIESVKVLLSRPEIYAEISKNGRSFVEEHFSWEVNTRPLIETILNHEAK